ncbi:MAG: PIG-L family deacetylase [Phototrophicales bacterium]|nr:MAG: PIG-L family deacetylase [Phototrophicales bacterium]
MLTDQYTTPQQVLAIYAHPDDAEFFAGGTIARWASEGANIILVLVTSGDKGSGDRDLTWQQLREIREAETRAAAAQLGISKVIFMRWRDGELMPSMAMRRAFVRFIRLYRPDAVLSSDPSTRWRDDRRLNHPDHWIVASEVMSAVYPAARDHLNFPELLYDEGLEPHITPFLYMSLSRQPNLRIITTDFQAQKLRALAEHRSQVGDDLARLQERLARYADEELSSTSNTPQFAEYFRLISLD